MNQFGCKGTEKFAYMQEWSGVFLYNSFRNLSFVSNLHVCATEKAVTVLSITA